MLDSSVCMSALKGLGAVMVTARRHRDDVVWRQAQVKRGVLYTREEAEGKRLKNPFDTITEGIGINRLTQNFNRAVIDDAVRGSDREAVEMASYLMR